MLLQPGLSHAHPWQQTLAIPRSEQGLSFPSTTQHSSASPCTFGIIVHLHRQNSLCCPWSWVMLALAC